MCLWVERTPSSRKESILVKCIKELHKYNNYYETPYRNIRVPSNGILKVKDSKKSYDYQDIIRGRHIHAYHSPPYCPSYRTIVPAYAINVKAYGVRGLVCKFLYIPIADTIGKSKEIVKKLERILKRKKISWADIVKIFPAYIDSFKHNEYYNIDMGGSSAKKKERINNMTSSNVVNWSYMLNEENVSRNDLTAFATGQMSGRAFESLSTTARKAVRMLGATEARRRARKALSRLPV